MLNIGVLVSGGGTNLQAILDAQDSGIIKSGKVTCVISSSSDAYALERAKKYGIESVIVDPKQFEAREKFDEAILAVLRRHCIDVVVFAGFMYILGETVIKAYPNKMLNVHPALIPSFCGKGFYGLRVHKAVLEYGVKLTGATVHFMNEVTDGGPIILQKAVAVEEGDTPELLQKRVMEQAEHIILPQAVELLCAGKLTVEGRRVVIQQ